MTSRFLSVFASRLLPIVGQRPESALALRNHPMADILGAFDQPGQRRIIQPCAYGGIKARHSVLGVNKGYTGRVGACGGHDVLRVCVGRTFPLPQIVVGLHAVDVSQQPRRTQDAVGDDTWSMSNIHALQRI